MGLPQPIRTGKLVIPYKYDRVGLFADGLVPVMLGDKMGYIDRKGREYWED